MDVSQDSFTEAWTLQNGTGNAAKRSWTPKEGRRSAERLGSLEEIQGQDNGASKKLEARLTDISSEACVQRSKSRWL